jgi:hypothetical protein
VADAAARPALPRSSGAGADAGAAWLARQVAPDGAVVVDGAVSYGDTAEVLFALAVTRTHPVVTRRALGFLSRHVVAATTVAGTSEVSPGSVAQLILDDEAVGGNPRHFGGFNLVTRLLATQRRGGRDGGLFGVAAPTYDGAYRQGLSLAALAAAGVEGTPATGRAVGWLERQQCPSGGWQAYRVSTRSACARRSAEEGTGPDTNSTALAVEGLVAQHRGNPAAAERFLAATQNGNGGWSYTGGPSDANSTALVIQALIALRVAGSPVFTRHGSPEDVLLDDQVASGSGAGGVAFQPSGGVLVANLLATEQAVPAMAGVSLVR